MIRFENSFARLPEKFYERVWPVPIQSPLLVRFNFELAEELGISARLVGQEELAAIFSGNQVPEGAEPFCSER